MYRPVLKVLFFLIAIKGIGQQQINLNNKATITGRVVDSSSKKPVEYATVTLLAAGTKKIVNGTTANKQGEFEITGIAPGQYTIMIEFIGYQPYTIKRLLEIKKNALVDLKTIFLSASGTELKNVTVVAQQKLIETKIDKIVFNAERDHRYQ
jgi:ferric enterobactin receptor